MPVNVKHNNVKHMQYMKCIHKKLSLRGYTKRKSDIKKHHIKKILKKFLGFFLRKHKCFMKYKQFIVT